MADYTQKYPEFYRDFGVALDSHEAALFVGAGISVPAGFKTWPELLREVATELRLDIERETDLIALAQFHVNERKSSRAWLNQHLIDEYDRHVPLTPNHRLIASLPVESVWTTNYDQLLERAFREAGKRCDVKVTTENLATTLRGKNVTIYKMHGDITQAKEAIITKDDYELYSSKRQMFTSILSGDLVTKTFLFLGFSFSDPNIDYILGRIRVLLRENARPHYCVMKWPATPSKGAKARADFQYDMRRLELRIDDLKRYGIAPLMIDDYGDITEILRTLNSRAHRNNIFVSGSTYEGSPQPESRAEVLARMIGTEAIKQGFNVVSGFGMGVGNAVLMGALEEVYRDQKSAPSDRIVVRPFPQLPAGAPQRADIFTAYRQDMLSLVAYAVFVGGTKLDPVTGQGSLAQGVMEEFAITCRLGKYPIPVGASGGAAKEIWLKVMANPEEYFPGAEAQKQLRMLGDESKTDEELIAAIFALIKQCQR